MQTLHPAAARTRVRMWLIAALAALLAVGIVPLSATKAMAAIGDYTLSLGAPAQVDLKSPFAYNVTLEVEATPEQPATGITLDITLDPGTTFDQVATGAASPVESYTYDAATRILHLVLKPLTQQLVSLDFSVIQIDNTHKYQGTVLHATATGSATPSGTTPTDSADTAVVAPNIYKPTKDFQAVAGTGNRVLVYSFAILQDSRSFSMWAYELTDVLPAGAVVVGSNPGWTITPNADGTTTVTFLAEGSTFPPTVPTLTVSYPAPTFPDGTRPPVNTVDLRTRDWNNVWWTQEPASIQGPPLSSATGATPSITVVKGPAPGNTDQIGLRNGLQNEAVGYNTAASFIDPTGTGKTLDSLTLTDSSDFSASNKTAFDHMLVRWMRVTFNSTLTSAALPYHIEYTTNLNSAWQVFTPANPTTAVKAGITIQQAGSGNYDRADFNQILTLPTGAWITGWKVVISPDAATSIPSLSQVNVFTGAIGVADGVDGTPLPAGGVLNTAVGEGTTSDGDAISGRDGAMVVVRDQLDILQQVDAPTSLPVGGTGTIRSYISNLDPNGRAYTDTHMNVVLPVGILFDQSKAITATSQTTRNGYPVPQVGAGVTYTVTTLTDADGEHQVINFLFDELTSVAPRGQASGLANYNAFIYDIPVIVEPRAYDPTGAPRTTTQWAYTDDPRYGNLPYYFGNAAVDRYNFDASRADIEMRSDDTAIITAGGLLLGKLVRAQASDSWTERASVNSPSTAQWEIYVVNVLPQPITDAVLFDRLPFAADANGSQFPVTLNGPVTGAPAGSTVEYSTDATAATNGTWTTNPAGATAIRVTTPVIAAGQSFSLEFPTAVPAGLDAGSVATNSATAVGTYNGEQRTFFSTEASIVVAAAPALTVVKKTNGQDVSAAPGVQVSTGSQVTWTYEVTNTGNSPLTNVAVSDAFTAGDGSTGTITATSTETGPLAPGATRTFTATGTAIAGQYTNTATATGTSVDAGGSPTANQPDPATDQSWYFASKGVISLEKTVATSEAGPWGPVSTIDSGESVWWRIVVTNTGDSALTNVVIADPLLGDPITIGALAVGESREVIISQTNVTSGYTNEATVTGTDSNGDPVSDGGTAEVIVNEPTPTPTPSDTGASQTPPPSPTDTPVPSDSPASGTPPQSPTTTPTPSDIAASSPPPASPSQGPRPLLPDTGSSVAGGAFGLSLLVVLVTAALAVRRRRS